MRQANFFVAAAAFAAAVALVPGGAPLSAADAGIREMGKPAKVSWSISRIENTDVAEDGSIVVEVSADKEILEASLWMSGSLARSLEVVSPEQPFEIPEGESVEVVLQLTETPDEAGHTIGGTLHLRDAGKNLAKPLPFSLKKTSDGEDDGEEEGEDEGEDDDGEDDRNGNVITWLIPSAEEEGDGEPEPLEAEEPIEGEEEGSDELDRLTLDIFEDGEAIIAFVADRDLTDVKTWLTPSLRDCLSVEFDLESLPEAPEPVEGEEPEGPPIVLDENGDFEFIAAGTEVVLIVTLSDEILDALEAGERFQCGGTLHIRNSGIPRRTWSTPLSVSVGNGDDDEDGEEELTEEVAPAAVVDAASFAQTPVAPGQIVSIFGLGLGPQIPALFVLNSDGAVDETLADTMVFFDGIPAPLLSAFAGQLNVIVPGAIQGDEAELLIVRGSKQSTPFPIPLSSAAPALFTLDGSGSGQAAALLADGTVNGQGNWARAGTVMTLFGTGAGPTDPPMADGEVATEARPLAREVRIFIGGMEADVSYSGSAPGLVNGVVQWNLRTHGLTPKGPQPVVIVVDGVESSGEATMAIR